MSPSWFHSPAQSVGLVLAAGASSRMGVPKALLPVGGVPLLRLHEAVLATQCGLVRVVLGAFADELDGVLSESAERVRNLHWASTGPRDSILLGLEGLSNDTLVVITPVDVPPVDEPLLCRLLERATPPAAVGHEGQPGHPVLVRAGEARAVLSAGGTLRDVLGEGFTVLEGGSDSLRNLNTPEAWTAWTGAPPAAILPGHEGGDHD